MRNIIKIFCFLLCVTPIIWGCESKKYVERELLLSIVKDVDRLDFFFYRSADTLETTLIDKEKIAIITSLIDGEVDKTIEQCKPSGHILYFKSNKIVFESFFTTSSDCEQLSYFLNSQRYNTNFNYKEGMLIDYLSGLATKK